MTTIKTTCTRCGDIHLTPDDVALELRPGGREGDYRFKCPTCTEPQRRPANSRVVSVLLATGVAFEVINPDPITEREIATTSPAQEIPATTVKPDVDDEVLGTVVTTAPEEVEGVTELPFTGPNTTSLLVLALGALGLGSLLVLGSRRGEGR